MSSFAFAVVIGCLMLLIAGLGGGLGWMYLRQRQETEALAREVRTLQVALDAMVAGASGMDRRVGTVEQRLFDGLQKMIAVRKATPAFADYNNRELLQVQNPHLFLFLRTHPEQLGESVLVVCNFDVKSQYLDLSELGNRGLFQYGQVTDLFSGESPAHFNNRLVIPPRRFYWLTDQRSGSLI